MRHSGLHIIRPLAAFLFAALLLATPLTATGAGDNLSSIVNRLQQRYGDISTIEADFSQEFHSATMGEPQSSAGKVYLKKPGKMRWDYTAPIKDQIVSDGTHVWVYQPDLNQVIERRTDAATAGIATDFLTGIGDLKKDFTIKLSAQTGATWTLELTPRTPQPNLQKLFMDVDKKALLVVKTRVVDNFGNETRVSFSNIKTNYALTDKLFEFKTPEGASVIRP